MPGYYLEQWQDLTGDISYSHARFKRVQKSKFVLPNSDGNLYQGRVPKEYPNTFQSNKLMVTSDGYVEWYPYDSSVGPEGFINKPAGVAKIIRTTVRDNYCYLYYDHHVNGLGDKRIKKANKTQYRLKVTDENHIVTQTIWDGGKQAFVAKLYYAQYSVGGTTYYTEVGEKSLD